VAIKPANTTYEEAVVHPYGAIMAGSLLRKVKIRQGQKVLINGASGGIGSAAVQLARSHYGAEVTGVCGALRAVFVRRPRRENKALRNFFFFSPRAFTNNVRRTQIPLIINN